MKTKHIALLIGLVVVVGFGGLWFKVRQESAWQRASAGGEKLLAKLPVGENLAEIRIEQGTNRLTLAKRADRWVVVERADYPANFAEISSLMLKLRDLKAAQTEPVGPAQLARLDLLPPDSPTNAGTRVEFRDAAGKVLETLRLGKQQMRKDNRPSPFGDDGGGFPAGRWLLVGSATDRAVLVSDPLSNLAPQPQPWLNKDFFKVEKLKAITVTFPEATNSWSVSRETEAGAWMLADARAGETLDSGKTSSFNWALSSPSFNDVGTEPPTNAVTLRLETFDGFTYTIQAGEKRDDTVPMTVTVTASYPRERTVPEGESAEDKARLDKEFADNLKRLDEKLAREKAFAGRVFLVSSWTLDALLKRRAELLTAPPAPEEKEKDEDSNDAAPADSEPVKLLDLPTE
jgi:hypothetical protein